MQAIVNFLEFLSFSIIFNSHKVKRHSTTTDEYINDRDNLFSSSQEAGGSPPINHSLRCIKLRRQTLATTIVACRLVASKRALAM